MALFLLAGQIIMASPEITEESVRQAPDDFDDDMISPVPPIVENEDAFAPESELTAEEIAQRRYLEGCSIKLSPRCGDAIFGSIFQNENDFFNDVECCRNLLEMGRDCHNRMVNFICTLAKHKAYVSVTRPKAERLWNTCVAIAGGAPSPSPSVK